MKKALCLLLIACLLPLGGCGNRIELAFMAVCLGVDIDEAGVTLTVKSPDYGSGRKGYATLQATGADWTEAVAALYAAAPVTPQFSQLREAVIGAESLNHTDALTLLDRLDQLPGLRAHALVTVCPGRAADLVSAMAPEIGRRLSRYLDMSRQHDAQQGSLPETTLSEALRDLSGPWRDPILDYGDGAEDIGGYALGSAGHALLSRQEVQLYRLARGQGQTLLLKAGGQTYGVESRGAPTLRVEADDTLVLHLPVYIAYSLYDAPPGEAAAQALREALTGLIIRLQAAGCDALGFGCQAARRYGTLQQWLAADWPGRYRRASLRVEIDARPRQQPLL